MIIISSNYGQGWEPIAEMVNLAAELFDAELIILDDKSPTFFTQLEIFFLKRQINSETESCLLVSPDPSALLCLFCLPKWRKRFSYISAWVIDSFWPERIPKLVKLSRHFDHVFITSEEDITTWTDLIKTPTSWLAWGSDVLRRGGKGSDRPWDLTRIGRQPPDWDDDVNTDRLCKKLGLHFHGRVKSGATSDENQKLLMEHYKHTKFLLAFSNTMHYSSYTHPSRQYITARWTDALACGAIVAGISPNENSINRLLWDGATLDLKSIHIKQGLELISDAVKSWRPEQATVNYRMSLERLDWRWRFAEIAKVMNVSAKKLDEEIIILQNKIANSD
jgi:hypothetical protein